MIPPASDLRLTEAEPQVDRRDQPGAGLRVTEPESEVSVIAPAPAETRTATARGTCTV